MHATDRSLRCLVLIGGELASRSRWLIRLRSLLSKATRLLSDPAWLLTRCSLIWLVELARGRAHLRPTVRLPVVRSAQQNVDEVHGWVVDKHPLIVGFLLVEDANGWILVLTGNTDNGSAAKCLSAYAGVPEDRIVAAGLARRTLPLRPARIVALFAPVWPVAPASWVINGEAPPLVCTELGV